MIKKRVFTVSAMVLTMCMTAVGSISAAPAQEPEKEVKTYGTESEQAVRFEFVNGTGKDITWFSIQTDDGADREEEEIRRMQEALIEQDFLDDVADGVFGPNTKEAVKEFREKNGLSPEEIMDAEMLTLLYGEYDDGNILDEKETVPAGEGFIVYYQELEEEAGQEEQTGQTAGSEQEFVLNKEYHVLFQLAGDEDAEYVLHTLPTDETVITILLDNDIAYVEYKAEGSDSLASTLEAEKAFLQEALEVVDYSIYDDGYYDDYVPEAADYAADPGAYAEPVQDNQTVDGCLADDALLY